MDQRWILEWIEDENQILGRIDELIIYGNKILTTWRLCWRLVKLKATIPVSRENRINNRSVRDQSLIFPGNFAKGYMGSNFDVFEDWWTIGEVGSRQS